MPNTQLETGEYYSLFMTSDALIHDSGSFMIEYLYANKPCLYFSKDINAIYNQLNPLGKKALDLHYKGNQEKDIQNFIENVVLLGEDEYQESRISFFNDQLLPPNGLSVAENIHSDLLNSLF